MQTFATLLEALESEDAQIIVTVSEGQAMVHFRKGSTPVKVAIVNYDDLDAKNADTVGVPTFIDDNYVAVGEG